MTHPQGVTDGIGARSTNERERRGIEVAGRSPRDSPTRLPSPRVFFNAQRASRVVIILIEAPTRLPPRRVFFQFDFRTSCLLQHTNVVTHFSAPRARDAADAALMLNVHSVEEYVQASAHPLRFGLGDDEGASCLLCDIPQPFADLLGCEKSCKLKACLSFATQRVVNEEGRPICLNGTCTKFNARGESVACGLIPHAQDIIQLRQMDERTPIAWDCAACTIKMSNWDDFVRHYDVCPKLPAVPCTSSVPCPHDSSRELLPGCTCAAAAVFFPPSRTITTATHRTLRRYAHQPAFRDCHSLPVRRSTVLRSPSTARTAPPTWPHMRSLGW